MYWVALSLLLAFSFQTFASPAEISTKQFHKAVELRDENLLALSLTHMAELLSHDSGDDFSNLSKEQRAARQLIWRTLEDVIGGWWNINGSKKFAVERKGGSFILVEKFDSWTTERPPEMENSPKLKDIHHDKEGLATWRAYRGSFLKGEHKYVYYNSDEYIGHNDWDFMFIKAKLNPKNRTLLSKKVLDAFAAVLQSDFLPSTVSIDLTSILVLAGSGKPEEFPLLSQKHRRIYEAFLSKREARGDKCSSLL